MIREHGSFDRPSGRSCLICFWEGYVGVAPTIVNAANMFAEHGFQVDIVTRRGEGLYPAPPPFPVGVQLIELKRSNWTRVARLVDFLSMAVAVFRQARLKSYDFVIGVDLMGTIISSAALIRSGSKFICWSLEIRSPGEVRSWIRRIMKWYEGKLLERADLIVAQDRYRTDLLRRQNKIHHIKTALIPNSALGRRLSGTSNFYLHDKLGIDRDTRLVLHAGMLCEEVMAVQLAAAAKSWPSSHLLVFHERMRRSADDPYLLDIKEAAGGHVKLSLDPVPLNDVDKVFSSARIGIVVYSQDCGENFSTVGFASGKLGYFLRNGIPIITNSLPALEEIIDAAKCGIVVSDLSDIRSAIVEIERRYDFYSENALKYFDHQLDFRKQFDRAFSPWLTAR